MPWLSIITALLSFFLSKKSGASNAKALLTAGLVGGGTYLVSHNTDWGAANLGSLDGVAPANTTGQVLTTPDNTPLLSEDGVALRARATPVAGGTGIGDVLKSWGASGTATVLGVGAASAGFLSSGALPWIAGGLLVLFLTRN